MSRLTMLAPEDMSADQRRVADEITSGPRRRLAGPFNAWLRSPELAERAQKLGAFLRFETSLSKRLKELAILVTARHWNAQFEWYAHEPEALDGGLGVDIIDAIRARQRPDFTKADEELVYEVSRALHDAHRIDDALYARAVETLGEDGTAELVGLLGYYTLVSMTLNVFEVPLPDGVAPPLDD